LKQSHFVFRLSPCAAIRHLLDLGLDRNNQPKVASHASAFMNRYSILIRVPHVNGEGIATTRLGKRV